MRIEIGDSYSLVRDWSGANVHVLVTGYARIGSGLTGVLVKVLGDNELLVNASTGEARTIENLLLVPRVVGETVLDDLPHGLYANVFAVKANCESLGLELSELEAIDRAFLVDRFFDESD